MSKRLTIVFILASMAVLITACGGGPVVTPPGTIPLEKQTDILTITVKKPAIIRITTDTEYPEDGFYDKEHKVEAGTHEFKLKNGYYFVRAKLQESGYVTPENLTEVARVDVFGTCVGTACKKSLTFNLDPKAVDLRNYACKYTWELFQDGNKQFGGRDKDILLSMTYDESIKKIRLNGVREGDLGALIRGVIVGDHIVQAPDSFEKEYTFSAIQYKDGNTIIKQTHNGENGRKVIIKTLNCTKPESE